MDQKWGAGFKCRRCGCSKWHKVRQWFYRRCSDCKYDESATANTLLHKSKLGILKAFEFAFRVGVRKKGMSTVELAKEFACQQKSAWLLKAKYQNAMKSSDEYLWKMMFKLMNFWWVVLMKTYVAGAIKANNLWV